MPDNQHVPHAASFEKALADGLKSQPGPGTDCPDAETLAAFWDQSLVQDERQLCEAHCATCARCQAHLAALAHTETVEEDLAEPETSRFGWLIDWRWLAPMATAAVVLLAVWGIDPAPVTEQAAPTVADFDVGAAVSDTVDRSAQSPQLERLERQDVAELERENRERTENQAVQENREDQEDFEAEVDRGLSQDEASVLDQVVPAEPGDRETLRDAARNRALAPTAAAELAERRLTQTVEANASGTTASIAAASADSNVVSVIETPEDSVRWRLLAPGRVEHSIDGGATWSLQLSDTGSTMSAGSAPSVSVCWIVGQAGAIFRTIDGGETWSGVTPPRQIDLTGVDAEDARSGPQAQSKLVTDRELARHNRPCARQLAAIRLPSDEHQDSNKDDQLQHVGSSSVR